MTVTCGVSWLRKLHVFDTVVFLFAHKSLSHVLSPQQAYMVRPWKLDKHVTRAFTVIQHLDLNTLAPSVHFVSAHESLFKRIQEPAHKTWVD